MLNTPDQCRHSQCFLTHKGTSKVLCNHFEITPTSLLFPQKQRTHLNLYQTLSLCVILTCPRPEWSTAGFSLTTPHQTNSFQDIVPPSGNQKCLNCHQLSGFYSCLAGLVLIVRSKEFSITEHSSCYSGNPVIFILSLTCISSAVASPGCCYKPSQSGYSEPFSNSPAISSHNKIHVHL